MFAPEYTVFVHHLRTAIQASSIQQVDLAARLGKSQSYISKALAGYQALTISETWLLLEAAEVPFLAWATALDAALRQERRSALKVGAGQDKKNTKPQVTAAKSKPPKVSRRS
jgi:transcriptional regulator with XRE-family HTH domain